MVLQSAEKPTNQPLLASADAHLSGGSQKRVSGDIQMAVDNLSSYSGTGGMFGRSANPAIQQIFNNMYNSGKSGKSNSSGRLSGQLGESNLALLAGPASFAHLRKHQKA